MGVEYKLYLIPSDNTYRPGSEDLSRLINALHDAGFLGTSRLNSAEAAIVDLNNCEPIDRDFPFVAQLGMSLQKPFPCPCNRDDITALRDREFRLAWTVDSRVESGLLNPLQPVPDDEDCYYDLDIHVAKNYVYETSEQINPFDEVLICRCGRSLEFDLAEDSDNPWFGFTRIRRRCSRCGIPFRPQDLVAEVRDARTGEVIGCPGGATYLFAVVVDCGKSFARQSWPIRAAEPFIEVVTRALKQPFYQVGSIY